MKLRTNWTKLLENLQGQPAPPATQRQTWQGMMQTPNIETNKRDSTSIGCGEPNTMKELCLISQVCPKTTGAEGEWMRRNQISTSLVMAVVMVRGVLQRVLEKKDLARGKTGIPQHLASSMSMKSPYATESISSVTVWVTSDWSNARRVVRPPEGSRAAVTLTVCNLFPEGGCLLSWQAVTIDPTSQRKETQPMGSYIVSSPFQDVILHKNPYDRAVVWWKKIHIRLRQ